MTAYLIECGVKSPHTPLILN